MKLSLTAFLSIDGVQQAPGGPDEDTTDGFTQGGWVVPHIDEDFGTYVDGAFQEVDAFLLGRRTYEIFAAHWPKVTDPADPVASRLNGLPKYVASRTLTKADWAHSTVLGKDLVSEVTELKKQPGRELQVHGSARMAQTLFAHRLVDTLRLLTFPVVLGSGRRLFAEGSAPSAFHLEESRTTGKGVVIQTYSLAGEPDLGHYQLPQDRG